MFVPGGESHGERQLDVPGMPRQGGEEADDGEEAGDDASLVVQQEGGRLQQQEGQQQERGRPQRGVQTDPNHADDCRRHDNLLERITQQCQKRWKDDVFEKEGGGKGDGDKAIGASSTKEESRSRGKVEEGCDCDWAKE